MTRPLNAFQSVRPRGQQAAPAPAPVRRASGKGSGIRLRGSIGAQADGDRPVLSVNGRALSTLAPRRFGSTIPSRAQSQAQTDKSRTIVRGGI